MKELIPISMIADYLFCPYSIYLGNIYYSSDDIVYKADIQYKGTLIHQSIDNKSTNNRKEMLLSTPVYSEKFSLVGKIDMFDIVTGELVERKSKVVRIFPGHIYQLWAQMICLEEMGYKVRQLSLYDAGSNRKHSIPFPGENERKQLAILLNEIRRYNPAESPIDIVIQKCEHCIYSNLCDKTPTENVFT